MLSLSKFLSFCKVDIVSFLNYLKKFISEVIRAFTSFGWSGSDGKVSACNSGDLSSIPGWGRSPGEGHGNPLQYSCLENPHEQRSLADCSPWGCKDSNTTEWLKLSLSLYTVDLIYLSGIGLVFFCYLELFFKEFVCSHKLILCELRKFQALPIVT